MWTLRPIGFVSSSRDRPSDDDWGGSQARIILSEEFDQSALAGLDSFSHAEILFGFHQVAPEAIERGSRHPRGNPLWPRVGIFAQRAKNRPNRLGSTIVPIVGIDNRALIVRELDAIDGTPVWDIKPVLREFLPRGPVTQPAWATELMLNYWREKS